MSDETGAPATLQRSLPNAVLSPTDPFGERVRTQRGVPPVVAPRPATDVGPSRRGEDEGRGQPCPNVDAGMAQVWDTMSPASGQVCNVAIESWRR